MSTVAELSTGFSLGAAFPPLPVCRFRWSNPKK